MRKKKLKELLSAIIMFMTRVQFTSAVVFALTPEESVDQQAENGENEDFVDTAGLPESVGIPADIVDGESSVDNAEDSTSFLEKEPVDQPDLLGSVKASDELTGLKKKSIMNFLLKNQATVKKKDLERTRIS